MSRGVNNITSDGDNPLVSIVMNCFNSAKYLREAIESVLAQTYQNWEIIFWDNQSTDESAKIFNSYLDSRLHYFMAPVFTRLAHARNLAVNQASGEWIAFLDCDDIWMPEKLERQVDIITESDSDLGLVYGQCLVIKSDINIPSKWGKRQLKYTNITTLKSLPEGYVFDKLVKFNFIPLVTAVVSKAVYYEVGGVSNHFEHAEDYELFIKIAGNKKIRAVQDVIALYRIHADNISIGCEKESFQEVLEVLHGCAPSNAVSAGLSYQNTAHALIQIKDGKSMEGIIHFVKYGRFLDLLSIVMRKFYRVL